MTTRYNYDIEVICDWCGITFNKNKHAAKRYKRSFCCRQHAGLYNKKNGILSNHNSRKKEHVYNATKPKGCSVQTASCLACTEKDCTYAKVK